jgi:mannose-6-phosphate isomerase-like protein (cupin superfamily)
MHYVGKLGDAKLAFQPEYEGHSKGYTRASMVDRTTGSVHTGLSLNRLEPGGSIEPHVHSFEEGFYILEGQAVVTINGFSYVMVPGDFAAVKVGTMHSWHNNGSSPVRWLQMAAPQPRPKNGVRDTFFSKDKTVPTSGSAIDLNNTNGNLLGHFDAGQIPPPEKAAANIVGSPGVFLKWLIDENLGARHHRLLFIQYQPEAKIGLHDHTFEEGYFVLSGEVEAVLDGKKYLIKPGDVVWTGVGCIHSFTNVGNVPVQWLETFSPQPPDENVFRFSEEWEKKAKEIEG